MSGRPTPLPGWGAPTRGLLRWLRGSAVATTATGLALVGHLAGGADAVRLVDLGGLFLLVLLGSVVLSGRRWTLAPLLLVLLGVQAAGHVALAGAGHQHGGADPRMVLAHVAAAVVCARLLRDGESWLWRLTALLARPLRALLVAEARPSYLEAAGIAPATRVTLLPTLAVVLDAPRRGPPVAVTR